MAVPESCWCPAEQAGLCGMGVSREGEWDVAPDNVVVPRGGVVAEKDDKEATGAVEGVGELSCGGEVARGGDVFDAGNREGVGATAEDGMAVEQHLPAHALFQIDDMLLSVRLVAVGAVVVVADDGEDAVGGLELAEDGTGVGQFVGLERHDVAGEGDKVGLEGVGLVDATLQGAVAVTVGEGVYVGELHNLVAVEGGGEGGEGYFDTAYLAGVALDEDAVGKEQHRQQQR